MKVETVNRSPQETYYEAVATVRSKTTTVLSSKITGNIVAVHVREGDRVKPGQLLMEIDNREAAAQLKKAQAGVREAEEMLQETERTSRPSSRPRPRRKRNSPWPPPPSTATRLCWNENR